MAGVQSLPTQPKGIASRAVVRETRRLLAGRSRPTARTLHGVRQPLNRPARCVCRPAHHRGRASRRDVDGWAREAERDASARAYANNPNCPGGQGRGGARAPCRSLAIAAGSVTTSRIFIRPPHLEQTVTSMAKTRARREAQPMRRGVMVASRSSSGRAGMRQSESCIGASGFGEDGMTRARRR